MNPIIAKMKIFVEVFVKGVSAWKKNPSIKLEMRNIFSLIVTGFLIVTKLKSRIVRVIWIR
jgi:hypothetical protein